MNDKLIESARKAAQNAYSPYSKFPVGAAVETEDGQVFLGCNIANASTPLGICAERSDIRSLKESRSLAQKGTPLFLRASCLVALAVR